MTAIHDITEDFASTLAIDGMTHDITFSSIEDVSKLLHDNNITHVDQRVNDPMLGVIPAIMTAAEFVALIESIS